MYFRHHLRGFLHLAIYSGSTGAALTPHSFIVGAATARDSADAGNEVLHCFTLQPHLHCDLSRRHIHAEVKMDDARPAGGALPLSPVCPKFWERAK
jgi:hypothetical protein